MQGQFQERRSGLTKHELECMLAGYPPWYRETFVTRAKVVLPFPIRDGRDVPRGGWIVAVGLMSDLASQTPLAVYRCPDEPANPAFRENGRTFRLAIGRCRDHIVKHIIPHFEDDVNAQAAVKMPNYLLTEKTGSGIPAPGDFRETWEDSKPLPHLRGSDCRFVMQNFNEYQPLDDVQRVRYQPILLPAMAATVHGAYALVQYLKDTGVELKVPLELANLDQEVYLRDCHVRWPPS